MTLKLLFAGDGPRDEATVPRLVGGLLGVGIEHVFERWQGLHVRGGGKGLGGYGRKLLFLIRVARDRALDAVVATVDCDKSEARDKLRDLIAARQRDRDAGHATPIALGEAVPHCEAWLIDDPVSVRAALQLPTTMEIASPTKIKSPKDELDRLHHECGSRLETLQLLAAIAGGLAPERCNHRDATGFAAFARDVVGELGPLSTASS